MFPRLMLALFLACVARPASAELVETQFGDWHLMCEKGDLSSCTVGANFVGENEPQLWVRIRISLDKTKLVLGIQIPQQQARRSSIYVRGDSGNPKGILPIRRCTDQICHVEWRLDDADRSRLFRNSSLSIEYAVTDLSGVRFNVGLDQLPEATAELLRLQTKRP